MADWERLKTWAAVCAAEEARDANDARRRNTEPVALPCPGCGVLPSEYKGQGAFKPTRALRFCPTCARRIARLPPHRFCKDVEQPGREPASYERVSQRPRRCVGFAEARL